MRHVEKVLLLGVALLGFVRDAGAKTVPFSYLVEAGKPNCTLVIADEPAFMEEKAAAEIADVILRDSGAKVPIKRWSQIGELPKGNLVVLGTPESIPLIGELARELTDGVGNLPFIGPDGYVVETTKKDHTNYLMIAGVTPRAVFYGAVYAGEQVIETRREGGVTAHGAAGPNADLIQEMPGTEATESLIVAETKITRAPAMSVRSPYLLGFAGVLAAHDLEQWKGILDGMAREGHNKIYFWWQSLYEPLSFPDKRSAKSVEWQKLNNQTVRELARYAHKLGMKFLLGGGAFGWGGASALSEKGTCPSDPEAWDIHNKFLMEMLEACPEADGIWFEPRDEHGECKCEICQKPVDEYGSKQYGQSEINFLKQFAKLMWDKKPDAELGWLIELAKWSHMHSEDPAYFARINEIKDPRFDWIVVWGMWDFPGPRGEYRPITFFSRNHVWWNKPYQMTLGEIQGTILKSADMGLKGYSPAFEPWFAYQYYHWKTPFPMDLLPYELTSYAFREFCWDPAQTMAEFKAKMLRRYFGPEMPMELVDDLIYLRHFLTKREASACINVRVLSRFSGEALNMNDPLPKPDMEAEFERIKKLEGDSRKGALDNPEKEMNILKQIEMEVLPRMAKIEGRLAELEPAAPRRAKASFNLIRRCIMDVRASYQKTGFNRERIDQYLERIEALRAK